PAAPVGHLAGGSMEAVERWEEGGARERRMVAIRRRQGFDQLAGGLADVSIGVDHGALVHGGTSSGSPTAPGPQRAATARRHPPSAARPARGRRRRRPPGVARGPGLAYCTQAILEDTRMRAPGLLILLVLLGGLLAAACTPTASPAGPPPASPPGAPGAPAAASGAAASAAGALAPEKLQIIYSSLAGNYMPLWIAADAGLFREQGLDVELVLIETGTPPTPA